MQDLRISSVLFVLASAALLAALGIHISRPGPTNTGLAVIDMQRQVDNAADTLGCETLSLTPKDVATYFSTATEVSAATFHAESIILPCSFSGTLMKGGAKYAWRIHAAGAGYLTAEATGQTQRFLCQAACEKALPALMGQ